MATSIRTQTTTVELPISDKRGVSRLSTYSMTPTLAPSIAPSHLSASPSLTPSEKVNPLVLEVRSLASGLARLDNPKLQSQRCEISDFKRREISSNALGAKLERALGRRMVGQDAVFNPKKLKPVTAITKVAA